MEANNHNTNHRRPPAVERRRTALHTPCGELIAIRCARCCSQRIGPTGVPSLERRGGAVVRTIFRCAHPPPTAAVLGPRGRPAPHRACLLVCVSVRVCACVWLRARVYACVCVCVRASVLLACVHVSVPKRARRAAGARRLRSPRASRRATSAVATPARTHSGRVRTAAPTQRRRSADAAPTQRRRSADAAPTQHTVY